MERHQDKFLCTIKCPCILVPSQPVPVVVVPSRSRCPIPFTLSLSHPVHVVPSSSRCPIPFTFSHPVHVVPFRSRCPIPFIGNSRGRLTIRFPHKRVCSVSAPNTTVSRSFQMLASLARNASCHRYWSNFTSSGRTQRTCSSLKRS